MTKLTKYNSFKSLKLSGKSNPKTNIETQVQLTELKDFFNPLRENMIKNRPSETDNAQWINQFLSVFWPFALRLTTTK